MARHLAALTDSIPERTTWLSLAQPELLLSTKVFVVLLLCIGRPTSVLCTLIHMPCIQVFFKKPCSSCTGYLVTPVGIPNRFRVVVFSKRCAMVFLASIRAVDSLDSTRVDFYTRVLLLLFRGIFPFLFGIPIVVAIPLLLPGGRAISPLIETTAE
eukprot:493193-Rhodomonas_salina.1